MDLPVDKLVPIGRGPLASGLREDRAYEGLTAKQWAYCEARGRAGMTVMDAYKHAYKGDVSTDERINYSSATATEANPRVQERIRKLLFERSGKQGDLPEIGKEFVITGIAALAINASKQSDQLRAYELLGKSLGLFQPETKQVDAPKTVNDVDAQLRERLKAALSPVIDVEADDITIITKDSVPADVAARGSTKS
jgi:hypothetical protein